MKIKMRKAFAAITVVALAMTIACNRSVPIDKNLWLVDELKGSVKSMNRIEYEAVDTMNQIVKGKAIDNVEGFGNIRLRFNDRGYWTEYRSHSAEGKPIRIEIPEYSNDGKMKMISRLAYRYRYDEKGNWIERIDYLNDKAVKIYERQIEYFVDGR